MNLNLLYIEVEISEDRTAKTCKLCQANLEHVSHAEDCPGLVLEGLSYEIHINGPSHYRSERDIDRRVAGASLESIAELAVMHGMDSFDPTYTGHVVGDTPLPEGLMRSTTERVLQRYAAKARAVREQEYVKAMASLEQDREDLSDAGYARRKALIETKYGPAPTGASTSNA